MTKDERWVIKTWTLLAYLRYSKAYESQEEDLPSAGVAYRDLQLLCNDLDIDPLEDYRKDDKA